jgi:hypothetical protein
VEDWNSRIEAKIDLIVKDVCDIKVTQAEQHLVLKDHTRRSLANEKAVEVLKDELKPVFSHVIMLQGVAKFIGLLGVVAGIVEGIMLWLKH